MQAIDPERQYSFSEARNLIPSSRGGRVDLKTLHRWRLAGVLNAGYRRVFRKRYWFVMGAEILRFNQLQQDDAAPAQPVRTAAEHKRAQIWARQDLERFYPQLAKS
jgi:hypothetical protein